MMHTDRATHKRVFIYGVLVFIGVLSTRWLIVDLYAVDFPFHDQWRAEGLDVFLPMHEGTFTGSDWFKAWNQHRIVLHRLWSTAIFHLNGQWDNQLQATANALWPALSAVLVLFWVNRIGGATFLLPATIIVWALFALPFSWENMLWGFQSQFHFLVFFSLAGMSLLAGATALRAHWFYGICALFVGLFSMGSGWVVSFSIACIGILAMAVNRSHIRKLWPTVTACAILVALGFLLNEGTPTTNRISIRYFTLSALHYLAWPLPGNFAALLLWAPWIALLILVVLRRMPMHSSTQFILMLGLWSGTQSTGMVLLNFLRSDAWHILARASKYTELLMFHVVAASLAALLLIRHYNLLQPKKTGLRLALVAWLMMVITGFVATTFEAWKFAGRSLLADFKVWRPEIEAALSDHDELIQRESSDGLLKSLRNPFLRSILPLSVRPSLSITAEKNYGFFTDGYDPRFDLPPWSTEPVYGTFRTDAGGAASFVSEVIQPGPLPLLVFPLTGVQPGQNERMDFYVEEVATGRRSNISTYDTTWRGWSFAWVTCPATPYRFVVTDHHAMTWLAFQMPREAGWGTRAGIWMRSHAVYLFAFFCACMLISMFARPVRKREAVLEAY